jgi:hypothetical protein
VTIPAGPGKLKERIESYGFFSVADFWRKRPLPRAVLAGHRKLIDTISDESHTSNVGSCCLHQYGVGI